MCKLAAASGKFYCVMEIETGFALYRGRSETEASEAMKPGTCCGVADRPALAQGRATDLVQDFREAAKKRSEIEDAKFREAVAKAEAAFQESTKKGGPAKGNRTRLKT